MSNQLFERRLAAIVAVDVVGYSRMMGLDETGTLTRLNTLRLALIEPMITRYHGRIVKLMGDGVLAEFQSVVDAVACAVEVQRAIPTRNTSLSKDQHIELRIGINLGDIIVEDDDIYGDGVNIAARLEPLAEPGGICLSQAVRDALGNKLPLDYEFMGPQSLKNITEAVRAFRVIVHPDALMPEGSSAGQETVVDRKARHQQSWQRITTVLMVLLLVIGGAVFWLVDSRSVDPDVAAHPLSDKPSIAVLPFENLNADPEQNYFADGIADDLITDLSKISGLFVTARNSSFDFRGKQIDYIATASNLGVRYLLEGSVRRQSQRIRINARLIDSVTGQHIWSERYDRQQDDIFAIQDEVTKNIVEQLRVNLTSTEIAAVAIPAGHNIDAYDVFLRGLELVSRFNPDDNALGREMFEKAIALDPGYARAHAAIALTHFYDVTFLWSNDRDASITSGIESAKIGMEFDELSSHAHIALASLYSAQRQYEESIILAEKAISLAPNYADAYAQAAGILSNAGQHDKTLEYISIAKKLNPHYSFIYIYVEALAHFYQNRFEEALPLIEDAVNKNPEFARMQLLLAATFGHLGDKEAAEWALVEADILIQNLSIENERDNHPWAKEEDRELYLEGLRKAGLGESF